MLALRRQSRAPFTIPLGPVIPTAALLVSVAILFGATGLQLQVGASFFVAGAILYGVTAWRKPLTTLCSSLLMSWLPATAAAQKLVILTRHAERADAGKAEEKDPLLSAAGEARAAKLAAMLADSGVKAIFATEFKRTQQTAQAAGESLGLTVTVMPGADTTGLVARLKKQHANGHRLRGRPLRHAAGHHQGARRAGRDDRLDRVRQPVHPRSGDRRLYTDSLSGPAPVQ